MISVFKDVRLSGLSNKISSKCRLALIVGQLPLTHSVQPAPESDIKYRSCDGGWIRTTIQSPYILSQVPLHSTLPLHRSLGLFPRRHESETLRESADPIWSPSCLLIRHFISGNRGDGWTRTTDPCLYLLSYIPMCRSFPAVRLP